MGEKGRGFARRVTEENLYKFAPLLRSASKQGKQDSRETRDEGKPSGKDKKKLAADLEFQGNPFYVPFPFTPSQITFSPIVETDTIPVQEGPPGVTGSSTVEEEWELVWESNELNRRDLNIPTGSRANPTGSMTLRKGVWEDVDQRSYFRDEVFKDLLWIQDQKHMHLESAKAEFDLEILGENRGTYILTVRHNTRKNTKSYKQRNAMSHLRWNEVKELIARRELLGKKLKIYRLDGKPPRFKITIN